MRIGQNPAKFIDHAPQPEQVTVAVVTYIPFLSGYYAQALDVLKVCLGSILAHTDRPFDLMVFDNASCPEVVSYLSGLRDEGKVQYLLLSDRNVGKVAAWNFIFGGAPGEYVAYADSDVYFYPGWLSKHLEVFEAFPEAGTVAGLPRRGRRTFYTHTIERLPGLPDAQYAEGTFIPDEWVLDHAHSLGKLEQVQEDLQKSDYRITRNGVSAYATATHFQFMVRTATVRRFLPFPYDRPMGESVAHFDHAINGSDLLRLAVSERVVRHIGNTLDDASRAWLPTSLSEQASLRHKTQATGGLKRAFFEARPVKRLLLRLYGRIFRIYYG